MKKSKKTFLVRFAVLCMMLVLTVSVVACGSGGKTNGTGSRTATESGSVTTKAADIKPVEISIFTNYSLPEPPAEDNPVTLEFEKRTNTDLKIMWTSDNDFTNKLNVILASGNLPDMVLVNPITNPLAVQLMENGEVWDFGPYIKDYPNLSLYPEIAMVSTRFFGKQYMLPSVRPLAGSFFLTIRKDWLDKLNLKVPETIDEFYSTVKTFSESNLAGEGKKVYGYTGESLGGASSLVDQVFVDIFNNAKGPWKLVDNKIVHCDLLPETREALLWEKKLYDEGIIPKDFSVMKRTQYDELAKSGVVGTTRNDPMGAIRFEKAMAGIDPNAEFVYIPYLTGPQGTYARGLPGFGGGYIVPKKVSEEKFKKILELMDYGASEEGFFLACNGIEGIHYNMNADNFPEATEQAAKDSVSQSSFGKIFERFDPYLYAYTPGITKAKYERNKLIIDEASKHLRVDPITGLVSETAVKLYSEYEKKSDDLRTKIILGIEPIESWDKYVQSLQKDADFNKIMDEYTTAYSEKHGK